MLEQKLAEHRFVVHHTSTHYQKQANACFLICAYQVIILNRTPEEAWKPFKNKQYESILVPYCDAGDESVTLKNFEMYIIDFLRGLYSAKQLCWYCFKSFDHKLYDKVYQVSEGDMNWIIPRKILAFSSPITVKGYEKGVKPQKVLSNL
jgi:cell division cycle 14